MNKVKLLMENIKNSIIIEKIKNTRDLESIEKPAKHMKHATTVVNYAKNKISVKRCEKETKMKKNNSPLYKRAHFRVIRSVINNICAVGNIDNKIYDLHHIVCYECSGEDLIGNNNVTIENFKNTPERHFLVSNNTYEVYECPSYNNNPSSKETGKYLVLFYNTNYQYYVLAGMKHNEQITRGQLEEKVSYYCYGQYNVSYINSKVDAVIQTCYGSELTLGDNTLSKKFDKRCVRKEEYHTSPIEIIDRLNGKSETITKVPNSSDIQIYKKHKSTKKVK